MMWVFAILIVAAMGVIAMLAAGHGEPMARAYDDRPDAAVPADRPLEARDLRSVRFSLALRGYRMSEVDALLERLASEMPPEVTQDPTLRVGPGTLIGDNGSAPVDDERTDPAEREEGVPHGGDEASDR